MNMFKIFVKIHWIKKKDYDEIEKTIASLENKLETMNTLLETTKKKAFEKMSVLKDCLGKIQKSFEGDETS